MMEYACYKRHNITVKTFLNYISYVSYAIIYEHITHTPT